MLDAPQGRAGFAGESAVSIYIARQFSHEPERFRVHNLNNETTHIESEKGILVVRASDYDQLRWEYDSIYRALSNQIHENTHLKRKQPKS